MPEKTLAHFKDSAAKLIEQHGAEKALAAALAVLSGSTEIKSRSLLSSKEVSHGHSLSKSLSEGIVEGRNGAGFPGQRL